MSTDKERERFDRKAAEHAYSISAFDYPSNPVGSRDWTLFWSGWRAARATPAPAEAPERFHPDASHIPPDYRDGWNACHDAWTRAAPPTAGAEREGWQWVPKVATAAMLEAAGRVEIIHNEWGEDLYVENTDAVYRAMLAAAPSAPSDQQGGRG